jgi:hypothetical protein
MRLLILWLCFLGVSYAQDFDHRLKPYSWTNHHSPEIEVNSQWQEYDAVILDAELVFDRAKQYVRAFYRVKFLTEAGIERYNRFWLPLKSNPLAQHNSKEGQYRPKFHSGAIYLLDARRLYPDSVSRPLLYERIERETFAESSGKVLLQAHEVKIRELKPGDEIEIVFSHFIRWPEAWLLEHELPIQNLSVAVAPDGSKFGFPADRLVDVDTAKGKILLTYRDIPPLSLPSFNHPPDSLHWLQWVPYGAEAANYGLFGWIRRRPSRPGAYFQPPIDALTRRLNGFAEFKNARNAETLTESARRLQAGILRILRYVPDNYGNARGTFKYLLSRDTLAQRFQRRFYTELLDRFPASHFLVQIESRLAGAEKYSFPSSKSLQWEGYVMANESDTVLLLPRMHDFGLQANEYPYYLSGARVWMVPRSLEDRAVPGMKPDGQVFIRRLPMLPDSGHYRKLNLMYSRGSEAREWSLSGSVSLGGQWSTMNRGMWSHRFADSLSAAAYLALPSNDFPLISGELDSTNYSWKGLFKDVALRGASEQWLLFLVSDLRGFPYGYCADFPFTEELQIEFRGLPGSLTEGLLSKEWEQGSSEVAKVSWRIHADGDSVRLIMRYDAFLRCHTYSQAEELMRIRNARNLIIREVFRLAGGEWQGG